MFIIINKISIFITFLITILYIIFLVSEVKKLLLKKVYINTI